VLRRDDGSVRRVVEERDATDAELRVTELLTSHFIFNTEALFEVLADVPRHPQTGERYLTDALSLMAARGGRIEALSLPDWRELVGLNTPQDLAWAERVLRAEPTFAGG
jgi:bifunctional N-acetylglucosamine-1-phosphate-uridyltransferase/glucosamine-1-phosphate-acetyltransferase GlmU-like protein